MIKLSCRKSRRSSCKIASSSKSKWSSKRCTRKTNGSLKNSDRRSISSSCSSCLRSSAASSRPPPRRIFSCSRQRGRRCLTAPSRPMHLLQGRSCLLESHREESPNLVRDVLPLLIMRAHAADRCVSSCVVHAASLWCSRCSCRHATAVV